MKKVLLIFIYLAFRGAYGITNKKHLFNFPTTIVTQSTTEKTEIEVRSNIAIQNLVNDQLRTQQIILNSINSKDTTIREYKRSIKLVGGLGAGYLYVLRNGQWSSVCDDENEENKFGLTEANVVCRSIGYSAAVHMTLGEGTGFNIGEIEYENIPSYRIDCQGEEFHLSQCHWKKLTQSCSKKKVVAIHCQRSSFAQCSNSGFPFGENCYEFKENKGTYLDAVKTCRQYNSTLLDILSSNENSFVSDYIKINHPEVKKVWLGGLIVPSGFNNKSFKLWFESQINLGFSNFHPSELDGIETLRNTSGIILTQVENDYYWSYENLNRKLFFLCKSRKNSIGCLDDPHGIFYNGTASRGESGKPCLPWNTPDLTVIFPNQNKWNHNYCRNPDGSEELPICFISNEEYDYCEIPKCGSINDKRQSGNLESLCNNVENTIALSSPIPTTSSSQRTCSSEQFECLSGECIFNRFLCDGEVDCSNGKDEQDCMNYTDQFQEIKGYKLQSKENIMQDVSLEECAKICVQSKHCSCTSFSYHSNKQRCLLSNRYSTESPFDAILERKNWNYYTFNSTFETTGCRSKRPATSQIEGIRLLNERDADVIEVKIDGIWGGICDDGFSFNEANVVCRQLGFPLGAQQPVNGHGSEDDLINIFDMECTGNETSIIDCHFDNHENHRHECYGNEKAGVICRRKAKSCEEYEFHCDNKECIDINYLCDGINQCLDGSDESLDLCDSPMQLRLVGGESENVGRVEIRHKGVWGTICDDYFDQNEAAVICRMMGYSYGARIYNGTKDLSGSGPIWIHLTDTDTCNGNELNIDQCRAQNMWNHDHRCRHDEDVAVVCGENDDNPTENGQSEVISMDSKLVISKSGNDQSPSTTLPPIKVNDCGIRQIDIKDIDPKILPRITQGGISKYGSHPWQASVRIRGRDKTYHWCGAVIISRFHLLTAEHCIIEFPLNIYLVRVGDHVLGVQDKAEKEYDIEKIDYHENYNIGPYLNNDIAILHIKSESGLEFGKYVAPICLPKESFVYTNAMNLTISGWGKNSHDTSKHSSADSLTHGIRELKDAIVPIISKSTCKSEAIYGPERLSVGMFCAGQLDGTGPDACQGDSGGPAVQEIDGKHTILGITSWGYGCGRKNKPGVYTKITNYISWIKNKTGIIF